MSVDSALHTLSSYQLAVLAIGSIAFGLYMLFKGGGWTIGAAIFLAQRLGLSHLFIGATVVAFGTSVPELVTSVNANLSGYPALSLGNVIGSNIANILLVTGATAMVFALVARPRKLLKDATMVVVATAALIGLMMTGVIERWHGLGLFAVLVAYVALAYLGERRNGEDVPLEEADEVQLSSTRQALLFLVAGLVGLIVGSEILVQGAIAAGTALNVPESVIGVTVVALGTSLPELATCLMAALRRRADMVVGNILGSNLFNILSIVGITALVKPLAVAQAMSVEVWVMAASTLLFSVWMVTAARIGRTAGLLMILVYLAFIFWQYHAPFAA